MRVLVVTTVHDPEDARIRHRQIASLVEAGHSVTFAAPFSACRRSAPEGAVALDLPRAVGRRRFAALGAARAVLATEAPRHDVVLLHDPELLLAAASVPRARRETAVVWDVHEDTPAALEMKAWLPRGVRPLAKGGVRLAQGWAERNLHLILAEYGYRPHFTKGHPVVPNTVPLPSGEPPPPGRDRVVHLGKLTRARGALDMLRLAELLSPDITVELIGGTDRDVGPAVRRAADDGTIRWHGFLPNDEALRLLGGALAGLVLLHNQPNYNHSRSTKAMEYMAHGVPVLTTPSAATARFVRDNACGVEVPFSDPQAAAAALRALAGDPARRNALAAAGRRAAVAQLNWADDGARFVALLESWAASRAPSPYPAGGPAAWTGVAEEPASR